MEALRVFQNKQFGEIRTSLENEQPLFCLADICRTLDIKNVADCKSRLNERGIVTADTPTNGGMQKMIFVNESNFYKVVFQSRKPEAELFTEWVTSEVLPSIRKTGGYMTSILDETPEETMARALMIAQSTIERTKQENERLRMQSQLQADELHKVAPKAKYYDTVLQSTETYATTRIAMEIGMSAMALNNKLRSMRVQRRVDGQWVLYAEHAGKGYVKPHTFTYTKPNGETGTNTQTVWTEKGRQFIHSLFK
jgi:prophage antirepressor-like protein